MANDKIEFDVIVNGEKAKMSLKEIEDAQDQVSKNSDKTTKNIKTNWKAVGIAATAAAAAIGGMMKSAIDLERAMFGLTDQTKKWIEQASKQYGLSQEMVAGFVQTGKASGLAGDEIADMIDMAVALGRAMPHESLETMIDDLTEFYDTGKEAGVVTRILEGALSEAELEAASFADKMKILEERTKGVNEEFDKTVSAQIDKGMADIKVEANELGEAFKDLAKSAGLFTAIDWTMDTIADGMDYASEKVKEFEVNILKAKVLYYKYFGTAGELMAAMKDKNTAVDELAKLQGDDEITLDDIIVDEGSGDGGRPTATGGTSSTDADKERAIALAANERFWDDYNATMMSAMEYELDALNKQFTEYSKYVTDKAALDEWYAAEQQRIMDEHNFQMQAYADMQQSFTNSMIDGITEFAETGKLSFKEFAQSLIQDLARIQIAASMNAIMGGISSVMGGGSLDSTIGLYAKGDAFANGKVTPFASGGVVNSPTIFPMANGMGLMGEAGAEAVMPLSRTSNGDLGVKATKPIVNVNVQNYGNDNIEVQQNGDNIDIIVSRIATEISRGTGNIGTAIEGRYGIRKQ